MLKTYELKNLKFFFIQNYFQQDFDPMIESKS